jgi:hypothetical protein
LDILSISGTFIIQRFETYAFEFLFDRAWVGGGDDTKVVTLFCAINKFLFDRGDVALDVDAPNKNSFKCNFPDQEHGFYWNTAGSVCSLWPDLQVVMRSASAASTDSRTSTFSDLGDVTHAFPIGDAAHVLSLDEIEAIPEVMNIELAVPVEGSPGTPMLSVDGTHHGSAPHLEQNGDSTGDSIPSVNEPVNLPIPPMFVQAKFSVSRFRVPSKPSPAWLSLLARLDGVLGSVPVIHRI